MRTLSILALCLSIATLAHASPASDALKAACADNPQHPICQARAEKAAAAKLKREAKLAAQAEAVRTSK